MSVNRVFILGNIGRDIETRYATSGDAVANISVATTEKWKSKSGEPQEKTEWHRLVAFGKTAEIAAKYLKKGDKAHFEGRLQTKKYDKNGVDTYSTEIIVDRLELIGGKRAENEDADPAPENARRQPPKPAANQQADIDDDIPF